jgi:alpha-mannosidase
MIAGADGKAIPSHLEKHGDMKLISFYAADVPSLGYKTFWLKPGSVASSDEIRTGTNFCENRFYTIEFGPGGITSLFDKETGQQLLNTTKFPGGDLLSMGYNGNGAGEFIQVTPVNVEGFESLSMKQGVWKLTSGSALFSTWQTEARMKNFTITQKITVFHQAKRIDFEYDIPDWPGEHNRQLRVAFPLNMNEHRITYDVPMGIVNVGEDELNISPRGWAWGGTYRQMPKDINPREIENFISASSNEFGVTLSTNLAVADWVDPSRESADYPVLQGILLSSHKSCHGEGNWYHQAGSHSFRLSLTSHEPGWKNGYHFGVGTNNPLHALLKEKPQKGSLPEELSFFSVSSPFVRLTTLKKSDDNNLIFRMVEMEGEDKDIRMEFYAPVKEIFKTNLIEEKENELRQSGRELNLQAGKNSIETYKIIMQ